MNLEIINQKKNPLFNRTELIAKINENSIPSRIQVIEELLKKIPTKKENIKIKTIKGKFGSKEFLVHANIYDSKQEKEEYEIKKKKDAEAEKIEQEKINKEKQENEQAQKEKTEQKTSEDPKKNKKEAETQENKEQEKNTEETK